MVSKIQNYKKKEKGNMTNTVNSLYKKGGGGW